MLYQVGFNSIISKNVIKVFKELYARKIYHGDIRVENILVRPDNSIVAIDFELSTANAKEKLLKGEMKELKSLLTELKRGH